MGSWFKIPGIAHSAFINVSLGSYSVYPDFRSVFIYFIENTPITELISMAIGISLHFILFMFGPCAGFISR